MYFVERYNSLNLPSGDLKAVWEFGSRGDDYISTSNGINSGLYTGGSNNFYSSAGSGAFGGGYAVMQNPATASSQTMNVSLLFENIESGKSILFSNYQTGAATASGFTFGLNDANRFFAHYNISGQNLTYTFNQIPVSKKNCISVNVATNEITLYHNDLVSDSCVFETYSFDFPRKTATENFFLGGNPDYESTYGSQRFSGHIDQFTYVNKSLPKNIILELNKGFKNYTDSYSNSSTKVSSAYQINYDSTLTGTIRPEDEKLINLLGSGLSDYFVDNPSTGFYTGLYTGNSNLSDVVENSGEFDKIVNCVPSGNTLVYSQTFNNSGILEASDFTGRFAYSNDGIENVIMTHYIKMLRTGVQPTTFNVSYSLSEVWRNQEVFPSNVDFKGYSGFKADGLFLTTGTTNNVSVDIRTGASLVPSGFNISPVYAFGYKHYSNTRASHKTLDFYLSGQQTDFSLSNRSIIPASSPDSTPSTAPAIYDLKSGQGTINPIYVKAGNEVIFTGERPYLMESIVYVDPTHRIKRNSQFYETCSLDLLHGQVNIPNNGSLIFNNSSGNWS